MASTSVRDLRFSVYINNDKAKRALIEMETEADKLRKGLEDLANQGKKDTPEYRAQKKALDEKTEAMNNQKKAAGLLSYSMNDLSRMARYLRDALSKAVPGTEKYKALEAELIVVTNRQKELKAETEKARLAGGSFLDRMSAMPGILGTVGSSLQGLGMAFKTFIANPAMIALAAIVGVGTGIVALVKNSMDFSKAMSQLSAITGATGDDLDYLKEQSKDLAAEYGTSAVEIVNAMKMVGSAKPELLSNVEALSQMTESVLVLSKATGGDLSDTTKSLTTIMNQFGLSADDANKTINVLAAGSKYGAVEVDYLSESIVKVGTIAKSAGISLEQTVSAMELFGEMGVKAEIAGTGFKSILGKLQADTRNYTNGLFDLNKAIDNNQSISNNNLELQKEFGAEFYGLAGILFQNKERFEELTIQVTNTQVAFEQFAIANDNMAGDIGKLSGAWDRFLLSIEDGDGVFARAGRYVIQFFTGLVNDITLLGQDAGGVITFIQESFQILGMQILAVGTTIGESFTALGEMARKAINGDFKGIKDTFTEFKKNVADAWNPKTWQGVVENTRAIKASEKAIRDKAKAEKEAALAKRKLDAENALNNTDGGGGTGGTKTEDEKKKKAAEKLKKIEEETQKENIKRSLEYNKKQDEIYQQQVEATKNALKESAKTLQDSINEDIADGERKLENEQNVIAQKKINEANFLADKIELAKNNIDETYRLESLQRERKMREELAVANLTEEQIKAIRDKYRQLDVEAEGKKLYEKQQKVLEWANTGQQILGDLNNFASALGQRELQEFEEQNRGKIGFDEEYAKKKAKIQRDEAIRAKALAALSVIVSTASAVIGALAPPPIGAGPIVGIPLAIAAGVSGAIQLAAILAAPIPSESGTPSVPSGTPPEPPQTGARVAVPQAAEGRYDVIGEQDRRRYSNVRYMGRARTGLVTTPTLYGEAGTELVIDAPTLRRLNTRAPGFNNFVLQNRTVPQRADGNYAPAQGAAPVVDNTPVMVANLEATNQLISLLSDIKQGGIEAFILYDKLQREQRIYENSVKKGSIR